MSTEQIAIIGCGKAKKAESTIAAELYSGSLFKSRQRHVIGRQIPYYIASAKYGLLEPMQTVTPYDLHIADLDEIERTVWALGVAGQFLRRLPRKRSMISVELHMGRAYADLLIPVFEAVDLRVSHPVRGMTQGCQMSFYSK